MSNARRNPWMSNARRNSRESDSQPKTSSKVMTNTAWLNLTTSLKLRRRKVVTESFQDSQKIHDSHFYYSTMHFGVQMAQFQNTPVRTVVVFIYLSVFLRFANSHSCMKRFSLYIAEMISQLVAVEDRSLQPNLLKK